MARPSHTESADLHAWKMRQAMPKSEAILWGFLRKRRLGARFRRQVPIGSWIADFACFDPRVVIEVDGPSHLDRDESVRTEYIESQGFTILRVTNDAVAHDPYRVADWIRERIEDLRSQTR